MRVLFVSSTFPNDLKTKVGGVYQRMRLFVDAIKEIASLDMLFYVPAGVDTAPSAVDRLEKNLSKYWDASIRLSLCRSAQESDASKWQRYAAPAFNFFRLPGCFQTSGTTQVRAFERSLDGGPDIVFVHKLSSICPLLLTKITLPPVLLDLDDVEHIVLWRSLWQQPGWRERFLYVARLPSLLWGERRSVRLSSRTFVCSELDRHYLADRWKLPGIAVIPNAVRVPPQQPLVEEPSLLFIGSYLYQPNVDAAEFLIHKVWPHVRQKHPGARLTIAGTPEDRIFGCSSPPPGVSFTGFVDDVASLYSRSRVVCAPILSGGGTRVKIIEAAAYAKAIVATRIGAEGLEMRDGRELLLRDDAVSFAEACLRLLEDPDLSQKLGSAARNLAVQSYDRASVVGLIQKHIRAQCSFELPLPASLELPVSSSHSRKAPTV
jgi:glycosyltransferase involved in cell wall biosynthesis